MNELSRLQVRENTDDNDWVDVGHKSGNESVPVTIIGGSSSGAQYTEGDTDASITGTAIMWEDADNVLASVSAANPLPVSASIDTTGLATDATDTNTATIAGAVTGTEMQVDVVTSALPTGAATAVNQQTDALTDTELRATPVPISGSVTADLGANNDVTVTGTVDLGATDSAVLDSIASPVATISSTPLQRIAIFDDSDTQITSFGGGVQYTEGDTDATITGTAMMFEGEGDTLTPVGSAAGLPVDVTLQNVALESGGHLETSKDYLANISGKSTNIEAAVELIDNTVATIGTTDLLKVALFDGSDTQITSFGGSGGTAAADDADFVAGTTQGTPSQGVYESSPTSVTDGDLGVVGITSTRSLKVEETNSTAILADTANMDTNIGTLAGAVAGTEMQVDVITMPTTAVTGTFWQATQPVSGTVTANLGATDNEVLDAIQTATAATQAAVEGTLTVTGGGGGVEYTEGDTDATITGSALLWEDAADTLRPVSSSKPLPVDLGANNDVTVTGTVDLGATDNAVLDDIAAKLGTIDADTSTLAAGVSTEYQVDVVGALPAGTNAIGKLAANTGVDIGDVDVTSVVPGTGASNLGKAEDAVHTSGDVGVMGLAVVSDSPSAVSGDYSPIYVNESGATYVTPDGGKFLVDASGNVAHDASDGGGPTKMGGRAQEPTAQPDEVADNDRVDALYDRNGYQRVRGDFAAGHVAINVASSGDNTIVAAAGAGKRIAVWSVMVTSDGTVDVRFEDGAAGTAITGQIPLQAREGFTYSAGGLVPLWVGSANTLLNLELSAAVNVHGHLSYSVIDD